MQQKRKRSKSSIIIAVVAAVLVIALIVVWRQYEAAHKEELKASMLTTDRSQVAAEEEEEAAPEPTKPARVIPEDPEQILVMAEKALKDEGYFETHERGKGFHVYFLLKKCLGCDGDPIRVEGLAKRLKELSGKDYGPWHVESSDLADLDEKIEAAKKI